MTLTIELTPSEMQRLEQVAQLRGVDAPTLVRGFVETIASPELEEDYKKIEEITSEYKVVPLADTSREALYSDTENRYRGRGDGEPTLEELEWFFEEMAKNSENCPVLSVEDTSREVIYADHG